MDKTEQVAVWQAWRQLSASSDWQMVVAPYLSAALSEIHLELASESCSPELAMRLLGRLSAYQELLDLPQSMMDAANQQERISAARAEQERVNDDRRRERPFAKWRRGLARR